MVLLLLAMSLAAGAADWDRIDFLCVVRDAQGRPVTNLAKNSLEILDEGHNRPDFELSRATGVVSMEKLEGFSYRDVYVDVFRRLATAQGRRVLVISGADRENILAERRWELIFLALRLHVVIYGVATKSAIVAALADETGGRIVDSEKDVAADLNAEYHVVAAPIEHVAGLGYFHRLQVVAKDSLHVQAPRHTYAVPPWDFSDEK